MGQSTKESAVTGKASRLTLSNYEAWKLAFLEQAMQYGDAGAALRTKTPFTNREPLDDDLRHRGSGLIISMDEFDIRLAMRQDGVTDTSELAAIEISLTSEYKKAYAGDIQFEEAYKRYIRSADHHKSDAPKLLASMLDGISSLAKEKIRAHPRYRAAESTIDYLGMWCIIE